MSKMSNAVVAGSRAIATRSGGDGICSVSGDLLMRGPPDCDRTAPLLIAGIRPFVGTMMSIPIVTENRASQTAIIDPCGDEMIAALTQRIAHPHRPSGEPG